MREGKVSVENVRFYRLMKNWGALNDIEKDLVFCWMLGAGGYLDEKELYEKLMKQTEKMHNVFL